MAIGSYYVSYNGTRCTAAGLYPESRPSLPTPQWRATKVTIPGRDGDLYLEDGALEDISIPITFGFYGPASGWGDSFRALKAWALSEDTTLYLRARQLVFSDDTAYRYLVRRVIVNTTERVAKAIGKATVTFICEGWSYLQSGLTQVSVTGGTASITMDNPTGFSTMPIFVFQGAEVGTVTFTFSRPDGTTGTFSVQTTAGQQYRINTRLKTVTNASGANRLSVTSGDLDEWKLQPGTTTVTITGNYSSALYYPMWRTL